MVYELQALQNEVLGNLDDEFAFLIGGCVDGDGVITVCNAGHTIVAKASNQIPFTSKSQTVAWRNFFEKYGVCTRTPFYCEL